MAYNTGTDYVVPEILDWLTGVADPPAVSAGRYLALSEDRPDKDGTFTELSGSGYARTDLSSKFPAAASGVVANNVTITTAAASGGDWNEVNWWVIMDASTSGNMIAFGQIGGNAEDRTVTDGNTMSFASGEIVLSIS